MSSGPVGKTQGAGWQIGVSQTLDHPVERVWEFLTSPDGRAVWLGHGVDALDEPGQPYATTEGTVGESRSFRPHDRVRLTWRAVGVDHESTVQVAVRPVAPGRTMLRFHQERITGAQERERQREHWRAVMASVVDGLEARR